MTRLDVEWLDLRFDLWSKLLTLGKPDASIVLHSLTRNFGLRPKLLSLGISDASIVLPSLTRNFEG